MFATLQSAQHGRVARANWRCGTSLGRQATRWRAVVAVSALFLHPDFNALHNKTSLPVTASPRETDGHLAIFTFFIVELTHLHLHPAIGSCLRVMYVHYRRHAMALALGVIDLEANPTSGFGCPGANFSPLGWIIRVQPIGFIRHLEHHVGGVSGVLGEHLAMYLATDFQPANAQECCTF